MRRVTTTLIHGLKDRVRGVRYSIRAEAAVPGSALPRFLNEIDFGPLSTIRSVIGTPALRVADGLFTQVEDLTTGVLDRVTGQGPTTFPRPIWLFGDAGRVAKGASFAQVLYMQTTRMLTQYGASNMLVSEYALDNAWASLKARHGDLIGSLRGSRGRAENAALVEACAAMACAYAQVRPIQRVEFGTDSDRRPRHLVLAPNLYLGLVSGLATAIVTLAPELVDEPDIVLENADAAVDARFARFKQGMDGKQAAKDLARQFEAILPYLR